MKNAAWKTIILPTLAIGFLASASGATAQAEGISSPPAPVPAEADTTTIDLASITPADPGDSVGTAAQLEVGDLSLTLPDGAKSFTVGYEIHVGGFLLAHVNLTAAIHEGRYVTATSITTKGLADALASANIQAISIGDLLGQRVAPQTYNSDQISPDKRQLVGLSFNHDGPTALASNPEYDLTRYPVAEDLKHQTVDPLSAALFITMRSSATAEEPCGETVPIFDGRRRYNLNMSYVKEDSISLGRNSYNGGAPIETLKCKAKYERVAGFKPPKRNSRTANFPAIDVWLAPFEGTEFYVPVRLQVSTQFGGVVVRAITLNVVTTETTSSEPSEGG